MFFFVKIKQTRAWRGLVKIYYIRRRNCKCPRASAPPPVADGSRLVRRPRPLRPGVSRWYRLSSRARGSSRLARRPAAVGSQPRAEFAFQQRRCVRAAHQPEHVQQVRDGRGLPVPGLPQVQYLVRGTGFDGEIVYVPVITDTSSVNVTLNEITTKLVRTAAVDAFRHYYDRQHDNTVKIVFDDIRDRCDEPDSTI